MNGHLLSVKATTTNTMKQELKPVTVNRTVYLVDPALPTNITGGVYFDSFRAKLITLLDSQVSIDKDFKIVAQPIGSKLDGIPYYQTEEETTFTLNDLKKAHEAGIGWEEYCTREEAKSISRFELFDRFYASLRKPRRIVSATVVMEPSFDTSKEFPFGEKPVFYTKEIDGKMLEFLKLDFTYE